MLVPYVALGRADGTFAIVEPALAAFGYDAGGWRVDKNPRMLADVNGDNRDDIVAFADASVYVALGNDDGSFSVPIEASTDFVYNRGWRVSKHPRMMADVNGDGLDDIVGFGDAGTYVAYGKSNNSFQPTVLAVNTFGASADSGGWQVARNPRFVLDGSQNKSGAIVGFGNNGVFVARGVIKAPQGYISIDRLFSGETPVYRNGTKKGFYNIDFPFTFNQFSTRINRNTFWNNQFDFLSADVVNLPPNYEGNIGKQNYLGFQVDDHGQAKVIFTIWWAEDNRAGPGATCRAANEIYESDVSPTILFDNLDSVRVAQRANPKLRWNGGTFNNCILNVSLVPNNKYTLRLSLVEDATVSNDPTWWGAWLINHTANTEQLVGQIKAPSDFGWLGRSTGGFIEQFGSMQNGCPSIPAADITYSAASADEGRFESNSVNASVYGLCKNSIKQRITLKGCGTSRTCNIKIK